MSSSRQQKIPRPPNAFIIYRSFVGERLPLPPPGTRRNQTEVSKIAGEMWRNESSEVKDEFRRQAAIAKAEHAAKYPDYVIRRVSKNAKEDPEKGKSAQREPTYPSCFEKAVGNSQGLHHSSALPEYSDNDLRDYLDYHDAALHYLPSLSDKNAFPYNNTNVYGDYHDIRIDCCPPPFDESDFFTREDVCLTNEAQLELQTIFEEEQELLHTLESLSFEQLMELYLSV
ncbi:hypothetical protein C0993_003576 [Termitomyces sp. T159_Od127]|nr:hypothetical protein C0993_003576 [Termitomyces sp. T159_Od127]